MNGNNYVKVFQLLGQIRYEGGRDFNYIVLMENIDKLDNLLRDELKISPTARERLSLELEAEMKRYREWREKSKKQ